MYSSEGRIQYILKNRQTSYESHHEKTCFLHMQKKKRCRSVTAQLISIFVFTRMIVQSFDFLNSKFQASDHLLWQYSLVCVRHGRKPQRLVFSSHTAHIQEKQLVLN